MRWKQHSAQVSKCEMAFYIWRRCWDISWHHTVSVAVMSAEPPWIFIPLISCFAPSTESWCSLSTRESLKRNKINQTLFQSTKKPRICSDLREVPRYPTTGECVGSPHNSVEVGNAPPHQLCTFCRNLSWEWRRSRQHTHYSQDRVVGSEVASRPSRATGGLGRQGIT